MKTLLKVLTVLCAVIGVYFMAMAAIEASSRRSDDRLHIAQLKGRLPFGKLTKRREAYDGEEVVARKIADYRDADYDYDDDDETLADEASAVTSRLLRKVKQADPEGKKRISRLRKAVESADADDDDEEEEIYRAEEIDEILPDAADFSEDALEDLLDD